MINRKFTEKKVNEIFNSYKVSRQHNNFELGSRIGTGGFSLVYDVYDREDNITYVAKIIPVDYIEFDNIIANRDDIINSVFNEVIALRRCSQAGCKVTKLLDVYEYESNSELVYLLLFKKYIAFEKFYSLEEDVLTEANVWKLAMSALETLKCLNSEHDYSDIFDELNDYLSFSSYYKDLQRIPESKIFYMIHRDIKPENFLIEKNGDEISFLMSDFGAATVCVPGDINYFPVVCTEEYAAPEIIHPFNDRKNIDLYSLGRVLYYLSTPGKLDERWNERFLPKGISREFFEMISRMTLSDYNERYQTASEVIEVLKNIVPSEKPFDYALAMDIKLLLKSKDMATIFNYVKKAYEKDPSDYLTRVYSYVLVSVSKDKLLQGKIDEPEFVNTLKDALDILEPLVKTDDVKACYLYALIGLNGAGVDAGYCKELMLKAADRGFILAEYYCGHIGYNHKNVLHISDEIAIKYLVKAVEKSYQPAVEYYLSKLNKQDSRIAATFSDESQRLERIEELKQYYLYERRPEEELIREMDKVEYLI